MYGRVSDAGMGTYPPRSALAVCTIPSQSAIGQWDWSFHIVRGGFDLGDHCFRPQVVGFVELWRELSFGDKTLCSLSAARRRRGPEGQLSLHAGAMSRNQSATSQLSWGFHTLQGGIDPGDLGFRPWVVGVIEIWKGF